MKILDCTLRDGGYYNRWDFDRRLVRRYVEAMVDANIDCVELGFRRFACEGYAGAHAFTSDAYVASLSLPSGPTYGVMIDAKDLLDRRRPLAASVRELCPVRGVTDISLVRVATHAEHAESLPHIVDALADLGYDVAVSIMQVSARTDDELRRAVGHVTGGRHPLRVLYFADSLGGMIPAQVKRVARLFAECWDGPIGFHAHDNLSFALINCLTALEAGVEWIDATVCGMGRGAGNVRTEALLNLLGDEHGYHAHAVFTLVIEEFEDLKARYGWGTGLFYAVGAKHAIHPTVIQELVTRSDLSGIDKLNALAALSGARYSKELLKRVPAGADVVASDVGQRPLL